MAGAERWVHNERQFADHVSRRAANTKRLRDGDRNHSVQLANSSNLRTNPVHSAHAWDGGVRHRLEGVQGSRLFTASSRITVAPTESCRGENAGAQCSFNKRWLEHCLHLVPGATTVARLRYV